MLQLFVFRASQETLANCSATLYFIQFRSSIKHRGHVPMKQWEMLSGNGCLGTTISMAEVSHPIPQVNQATDRLAIMVNGNRRALKMALWFSGNADVFINKTLQIHWRYQGWEDITLFSFKEQKGSLLRYPVFYFQKINSQEKKSILGDIVF